MNAAIRSIVLSAVQRNWSVVGFLAGYRGLLEGRWVELTPADLGSLVQRGGTILKTSRCPDFARPEGIDRAKQRLQAHQVDSLIIIGGDGSLRGGHELAASWSGQVIGVPGTIDNDLFGTDCTIGYDTAVNTAVEAIDRIRDTAEAYDRWFIVEVMGRRSGFIALEAGLAAGAEQIVLPEAGEEFDLLCQKLVTARLSAGERSSIIVVAEAIGAALLAQRLRALTDHECRVVTLSYIQRGGRPTASDRLLATQLGAYAVEVIAQGGDDLMVGELGGRLATTPLEQAYSYCKPLDPALKALLDLDLFKESS